MSPVEAMRGTSDEAPRGLRRRSLLGAVVAALGAAVLLAGLLGAPGNPLVLTALGAAVTFVGVAMLAPLLAGPVVRALGGLPGRFGVAGRLAVRNTLRNRRRTAATASALMIGLALVSFVTILAASLTASVTGLVADQFAADFILNSGGAQFGALPPSLSESLAEAEEIEAVSPLRGSAFVDDQDTQRSISGVNPAQIRELIDLGDVEGDLDGISGAQVAVTFDRAEELGLEIGDTLTASFPAAPDETLEVAALYETPDLVGAHFLADAGQVAAWSGPLLDVAVFATAAGDREAARATIEDAVAGFPNVAVQDQAEFREEQEQAIDQLLGLLTALLLLAVVIALLGIANTLALSIFERTREIGLLRAVGMVRRQTRRMVMWESVLTALFGAVLGVTVGAFFGWAVTTALARAEGLEEFVIPVGQLVVYAVIAGVAGVAAAVLPAWRAARLDVLEAVTAE